MAACSISDIQRDLITANHILHYHEVVDAYGHISVRHPERHDVYLMSGYLAPAVVESPDDLIEYRVSDSSPTDPQARKGYAERFIHGELFKRFPDVNCVIHSHSEDVLPYIISDVPLRPVFHMAGFLGTDVPTFDIAPLYRASEQQDMLVKDARFGAALAATFSKTADSNGADNGGPDYSIALMRRHGFTTVGTSIPEAVYRAIYTCTNARLLTSSINLRRTSGNLDRTDKNAELHYLTPAMNDGCQKMNEGTQDKPWKLWVKEAEMSPLYTNKA